MPDLGNSRRKLKIAIGAMLAVDVVAMAVLFSPLVCSAESRRSASWIPNRSSSAARSIAS